MKLESDDEWNMAQLFSVFPFEEALNRTTAIDLAQNEMQKLKRQWAACGHFFERNRLLSSL